MSSLTKLSLKLQLTSLHSSRMRTARALTVSPSMIFAGGGGCLPWGVCFRRGLLWGGGCLLLGGLFWGGVSALWGVCSSGGCLLLGRWYPSMH